VRIAINFDSKARGRAVEVNNGVIDSKLPAKAHTEKLVGAKPAPKQPLRVGGFTTHLSRPIAQRT
jgi:hypothetical protein